MIHSSDSSVAKHEIEIAQKIMRLIFQHQRLLKHSEACQHDCLDAYAWHYDRLIKTIRAQQAIYLILPAFPAKSANQEKTASHLPDMGERLALKFLNQLCETINQFYEPGAIMLICSDGRVFNDLVRVSNENVTAYAMAIRAIIGEESLCATQTFDLDDHYECLSYVAMREKLMLDYGDSLDNLKERVKNNAASNSLFNGIHRFIFEDHLALMPHLSRNQVRELAKQDAYQVVLRSNAWSRLIAEKFPQAIRLSIHPQVCGAEKIGIMLLKSRDVWTTPWHSVPLFDGTHYHLVKHKEAEALQAKAVFANNQFSHYVI